MNDMGIYITERESDERYQYSMLDHSINESDVIIPFSYHDEYNYQITYFTFLIDDFVKFNSKWLSLSTQSISPLKNLIKPIRVVVQDVMNQRIEDYQLIELISLQKISGEYVINYRFLGQLVEREIANHIVQYYLNNPDESIKQISDFIGETETREALEKFKLNMDFSSELVEFDAHAKQFVYNKEKGIWKILCFEEGMYSTEDFVFRRFPKQNTNRMIQMVFTEDSIDTMRIKMEETLIALSVS